MGMVEAGGAKLGGDGAIWVDGRGRRSGSWGKTGWIDKSGPLTAEVNALMRSQSLQEDCRRI